MTGILITGTSSDAGKTLVVTGLCRVAARRGIAVAPFKAQNMSNNSVVAADGSEISRAQWLQAQAAGIPAVSAMNPVLLKPGADCRSSIVLRGQAHGILESGQYTTGRRGLAEAAWEAYRELAASYDLVICEGAGSPAEINLRAGDYTNMGLAREMQLPVYLVGDIDRGGVLASIYGTWGLLDDADRALLAGYLINKFRGDQGILAPGLAELTRRTGLGCYGVLPWLPGVWIDGEDSLEVARWRGEPEDDEASLRVAAVRLPRMTNSNDFDGLAYEPGVNVQVTEDPLLCAAADLVVLPGSQALASDLAWLRDHGIADVLAERVESRRPVLAVGSGYHLLGRRLTGPEADLDGLGLLPISTTIDAEPDPRVVNQLWRGHEASGFQILATTVDQQSAGEEVFLDGMRVDALWATPWSGALESDGLRREFLQDIAQQVGRTWQPTDQPGFNAAREQLIDTVADALETHCEVDALLAPGQ